MRARIVSAWLIEGLTHRQIDQAVLKLAKNSRGFQSHGVLKHLGLGAGSRGIFRGREVSEVIDQLRLSAEHSHIADTLMAIDSPNGISQDSEARVGLTKVYEDEYAAVRSSLRLSGPDRINRIERQTKVPEKILVTTYVFRRNPDVVAEALIRANGLCEHCGAKAPFFRSSDRTPYLEVHHVVPMSSGGLDTLENVMALCPNCHRKMHFG